METERYSDTALCVGGGGGVLEGGVPFGDSSLFYATVFVIYGSLSVCVSASVVISVRQSVIQTKSTYLPKTLYRRSPKVVRSG